MLPIPTMGKHTISPPIRDPTKNILPAKNILPTKHFFTDKTFFYRRNIFLPTKHFFTDENVFRITHDANKPEPIKWCATENTPIKVIIKLPFGIV